MAVWNPIQSESRVAVRQAEHLIPSPWCNSWAKRTFDFVLASVLLLCLAPLMVIVAIAVKLSSSGPIIFKHQRCGKGGQCFNVLKFRTMSRGGTGPSVTRSGDARVTRLGRILRKWKIDEFPQLFNVLRGEMSLVGPRPDVAEFFERATEDARTVLSLRPGVTGWASICFRNEEELLAEVPAEELQDYYVDVVLPHKADLDLRYAAGATLVSDIGVLVRTVSAVLPIKRTGVS